MPVDGVSIGLWWVVGLILLLIGAQAGLFLRLQSLRRLVKLAAEERGELLRTVRSLEADRNWTGRQLNGLLARERQREATRVGEIERRHGYGKSRP